jgi:restriction system protein
LHLRNALVRLRAEEYEALFYKLLHRVGYTEEEYDGDYAGIRLFHKYKKTHAKKYKGVLALFVEMWPRLIDETIKKGGKAIDPSPFLDTCLRRYGRLGLQMGIEQIEAIDKGLHMSPHSPIRYTEWKNVEELRSLFQGGGEQPEVGEFIDQRFIDYLSNNPHKLETMHWRKFEELTAEFFFRAGFQIELGPGQNDDGVDVRIWKPAQDTGESPHCIIQCKRQRQKIEKVVIKGLFSDVQFMKAEYGLIVTSSELSRGASDNFSQGLSNQGSQ